MTDNDQGRRRRQNVAAIALLVIVTLAGSLLFVRFMRDVAVMKCVTAGRQDCIERLAVGPR